MPLHSLQYRVKEGDFPRYHGGTRVKAPKGIIIHCTAGDTVAGAVGWMNRILKNGEGGKTSYDYLIEKDGTIVTMGRAKVITYHAGKSRWHSLPSRFGSLNHCTLGIAFANDNGSDNNPHDDPLTIAQIESCTWLCCVMIEKFPTITVPHILGHIEVSPGRKFDPLPRILNMDWFRAQVREELLAR